MELSSSLCIQAFVFLCCFGLSITSIFGGGNETDRLALLDFKAKITLDPLEVMGSWNDSIHFCQWQGVTCGRRHQRVIKLDLQSQSLVGSILSHVGNLSFLRQLILANNGFIHAIPPKVGRSHRLQNLRLENNSISGQFPSNISSCTNLLSIMVSFNQLVGEIPVQLTTLSKLQEFSIGENNVDFRVAFRDSIPKPNHARSQDLQAANLAAQQPRHLMQ
ncbi:LRR receptor-like serine/threonine-protein kinase EFR [Morella rubra]|uniref:LRR receptor-like serine/threonine-protein kinase EFR n=1 Tax=Morella rubra TaxID=262757 RepID=A0A6A1VSC3_9ROSI|nr:LRR receptor-like serine/threonine-protein kinase EFR [Morella rubra]KAB1215811.1 LRR receptor-like serine/threonine-protein kinase EFR [Morella rubra]